ncbi:MAG: hypothetical protein ACR2F8_07375 [Caulobacteraceae bacterium]
MNLAAGLLAASVLADSGVEHYRGSFHNRAMFAPLAASALALAVSAHGLTDHRRGSRAFRDAAYAAAGLTGLLGTGFHLYNIVKKPGGFPWLSLFYSAPVGAPAALSLAGLMGFLAERVRDAPPGEAPRIGGVAAGRVVAALASAGIAGTVGEAGLLHFRGAYHNPFMFAPVSAPPVAAALLAKAAVGTPRKPRPLTRWWLRLTAALGLAGVGFHAWGVSRGMGGWRNWSQNVLNGPPLPAPPAFTALAIAGLAALGLMAELSDG